MPRKDKVIIAVSVIVSILVLASCFLIPYLSNRDDDDNGGNQAAVGSGIESGTGQDYAEEEAWLESNQSFNDAVDVIMRNYYTQPDEDYLVDSAARGISRSDGRGRLLGRAYRARHHHHDRRPGRSLLRLHGQEGGGQPGCPAGREVLRHRGLHDRLPQRDPRGEGAQGNPGRGGGHPGERYRLLGGRHRSDRHGHQRRGGDDPRPGGHPRSHRRQALGHPRRDLLRPGAGRDQAARDNHRAQARRHRVHIPDRLDPGRRHPARRGAGEPEVPGGPGAHPGPALQPRRAHGPRHQVRRPLPERGEHRLLQGHG